MYQTDLEIVSIVSNQQEDRKKINTLSAQLEGKTRGVASGLRFVIVCFPAKSFALLVLERQSQFEDIEDIKLHSDRMEMMQLRPTQISIFIVCCYPQIWPRQRQTD